MKKIIDKLKEIMNRLPGMNDPKYKKLAISLYVFVIFLWILAFAILYLNYRLQDTSKEDDKKKIFILSFDSLRIKKQNDRLTILNETISEKKENGVIMHSPLSKNNFTPPYKTQNLPINSLIKQTNNNQKYILEEDELNTNLDKIIMKSTTQDVNKIRQSEIIEDTQAAVILKNNSTAVIVENNQMLAKSKDENKTTYKITEKSKDIIKSELKKKEETKTAMTDVSLEEEEAPKKKVKKIAVAQTRHKKVSSKTKIIKSHSKPQDKAIKEAQEKQSTLKNENNIAQDRNKIVKASSEKENNERVKQAWKSGLDDYSNNKDIIDDKQKNNNIKQNFNASSDFNLNNKKTNKKSIELLKFEGLDYKP